MSKKRPDWMKKPELERLAQQNTYTMKLPTYAATFGLTAPQTTAARTDYLWSQYACDFARMLETEWGSAVDWKTQLNSGGPGTTQPAPTVGTEVQPPAGSPVADGILSRWREQVDFLKSHPAYTVAIGLDLGIEATEEPVQQMKPTFKLTAQPAGVVALKVKKDGHQAAAVYCQRGANPIPEKLGTYSMASITDARANAVAGVPEKRTYTVRYVDGDVEVGELSDACSLSTQA